MKILFVSTVSSTVNAFLLPHIKMLIEKGHQVDIACNINNPISPELNGSDCKIYNLEFSRSPHKKGNITAYKKLKKVISINKYDIVHTHTPVASFITRMVCKNMDTIKTIYTAHGFHFYKGAPLKNWLIYYPLEKLLSHYTDTLITINKEDFEISTKKFKAKRNQYIPGVGLDIKKINNTPSNKDEKRKSINVPIDAFVILSVGELNKNKNHEIVIKAMSKMKNQKIHYVICGKGSLDSYLKDLASDLKVSSKIHILGLRTDVIEILKASDLFILPSLREGLPVSLIEAMAVGLPVIGSNIRGNIDLIKENKGGFLYKKDNMDELIYYISKIYYENELAIRMGEFNKSEAQNYKLESIIKKLEMVYT
ncbi:glycosyltransferase family 4 protein [Jeotgalibaca ciconiae]|uniref:Glycosyltransferase family 1 protein n=1 Tax=Jeotgalibaca ciconiae TaxID=2496265 RepID=A0A3S9HC03_9LACT|nr:glycosyltransferase family 4 protein [Jeotgalibaca ciconiae]AZP04906.1 glycosyltransferase family 1 protein [Jeotgalibaca ciconiae]